MKPNSTKKQQVLGDLLSPFNIMSASTEDHIGENSSTNIHDILIKESPCDRIPNAKVAGMTGNASLGLVSHRMSPKNKKISNDCLK